MLNKMIKISYIMRIILFLLQFYFFYASLYCVMSLTYIKYIFLSLYFIYVIITLFQFLSKKKKYQDDLINNLMHLGIMLYIIIVSFRMNYSNVYVTNLTLGYFNINYGILGILMIFALVYSFMVISDD